jgi:hypothetical protein
MARGNSPQSAPGRAFTQGKGTMTRTQGVLLAVLLGTAGTIMAAKGGSVVDIRNDSDWAIHELYVSSVDDNDWGSDQLGREVIESGGSFKLHSIPCDDYDVRLVDEDGDVCVVGGVTLCAGRDIWQITNDDLLTCQALTE